jgi:hypothetical protein
MGNQILDEHWREQWPRVDDGEKISTQKDDLLLLKREEQQFQSLGQRMDDNKDNELIVQKSNWFVGFWEACRSIIGSCGYCWKVMGLVIMWERG